MKELIKTFPFNLARDIFGSEERAYQIYVPGIYDALETIGEREKEVVISRYRDRMKYKDMEKRFGISKTRLIQIIKAAIRKLRHPKRTKSFKAIPLEKLIEQKEEYRVLAENYGILKKSYLEKMMGHEMIIHKCPEAYIPISELPEAYIPISELGLSGRSFNALKKAGVGTLGDIAQMTEAQLKNLWQIGDSSLSEIVSIVRSYGLDLKK